MEPSIFFFDMDHTIINRDCDLSWKKFLVEKGIAKSETLDQAESFFRDYANGRLDIERFMEFQLSEFKNRTIKQLQELAQQHFVEYIKPRIYQDAVNTIRRIQRAGKPLAVLTATNYIIARPLTEHIEVDALLAVRPEVKNNLFTGRFIPPYSGGSGKVVMGWDFCRKHGLNLTDAAYFGDSPNDLPILEAAGFPRVVNPEPELRKLAEKRKWTILKWS